MTTALDPWKDLEEAHGMPREQWSAEHWRDAAELHARLLTETFEEWQRSNKVLAETVELYGAAIRETQRLKQEADALEMRAFGAEYRLAELTKKRGPGRPSKRPVNALYRPPAKRPAGRPRAYSQEELRNLLQDVRRRQQDLGGASERSAIKALLLESMPALKGQSLSEWQNKVQKVLSRAKKIFGEPLRQRPASGQKKSRSRFEAPAPGWGTGALQRLIAKRRRKA